MLRQANQLLAVAACLAYRQERSIDLQESE